MLYRILFDNQPDYVEADNFTRAIDLWREHLIASNEPGDFDESVQPESVELVHEEYVLRKKPFCTTCDLDRGGIPEIIDVAYRGRVG